eukprot:CAMPEP_0204163924 /NCGR_PEP_ID=MMETSP0361-20130328/36816_1 /ASSEMBLY_ACC=CAM_ASM_000343 /TAXON_ID=268821 /ORGANISM="Scrippsiella Hangoei, Strain SHTV-5" /LENGTH=65 /DNA_ID=CAMNT_0051120697 /DNA_START=11 /DNA_END=204 /DNA_ORIENTATION=+
MALRIVLPAGGLPTEHAQTPHLVVYSTAAKHSLTPRWQGASGAPRHYGSLASPASHQQWHTDDYA